MWNKNFEEQAMHKRRVKYNNKIIEYEQPREYNTNHDVQESR